MVSKIQDWLILTRNRLYHLHYKSVPLTIKRPLKPETGIIDGFEEIELKFLFGALRPRKQDYLFRCYVAPGNFQ